MSREKKNREKAEESLLPEEDPAELTVASEPESQTRTAAANPKKTSTFGGSLWRGFVFLFKLGLFMALLGGIGAALYFGLPVVYDRYILPVQQNTSKLAGLETRQAQTDQQLAGLQTQVTALQAQLAASATEQSSQNQTLAKLEARVKSLEAGIAAQTQSIAALETLQAALQAEGKTASAELDRQIKLLKSMELLTRARLFLYESNFGLAKADIQAARDLLGTVQPSAPAPLDTELAEVLHRLDRTLGSLPGFPVAASDDLDIAWQILLQGIPLTPAAETALPTTAPSATETPAPAGTAEATPAPTATP
jgi:uncharacterized coiled-coil protein SlyX